ncbi:trypsin-like peptidase domain-containing protein [Streptomyces sp. NP-1717]|uniref:trypsin-like peptidase domain-containing protein n=1 Tax=Streptomyces sp. NP-1717 TaxID=2704470 RepID=UPI001F5E3425|nr:tetratricopeptide repeat-containing serine protease family protein [Streptomyces sp. NP-1717]MCI3223624.1 serine protease [Streptomyces sp. NP-1717]
MTGIDRRRLVEVWAGPTPHGWAFGTGTWLAGGLILTARHVVTDAAGDPYAEVKVRHMGGTLGKASIVWSGTAELDAALLSVAELGEPPLPPLRWGRLCGRSVGVDAQAIGFPDSVTPEASAAREVEQVGGEISPLAGARSDRHLMTTRIAPRAGVRSLWKGISGAAVTCGNLLCGVVVEDPPQFESRRLTVVPVHALAEVGVFRTAVQQATGHLLHLEPVELQGIGTPWNPAIAPPSPAALLRPEYESVPFRPRAQLADLHAWCDGPQVLSGLLMTGPGGQGKSRLARQLARERAGAGWVVCHLAYVDPADHYAALTAIDVPLLLVIDYAERRTAVLAPLVNHLAAHPTGHPVRLLLLGRTDGDWWAELVRTTTVSAALREEPLPLSPLEGDTDQVLAYQEAADALAVGLSRVPGYGHIDRTSLTLPTPAPDALGGGHALTVHMTALAALLNHLDESAGSTPLSQHPEEVILAHERTYWDRVADHRGLGLEGLRLSVVGAALLAGAATREQATATLALLPGLRGDAAEDNRRKLASWIGDLYPPDDHGGGYWGTLHPDRLTEYHLTRTLADDSESALLETVLPHLSESQATRALTVLSRALALPTAPAGLADQLEDLVTRHPDTLGPPAVGVVPQAQEPAPLLAALRAICDNAGLPIGLSHDLYDAVPWHSQRLAEIALVLSGHQAAYYEKVLSSRRFRARRQISGGRNQARGNLATALVSQSEHLSRFGQCEEALTAISHAVGIRRKLKQAHRKLFLLDLAGALNDQSSRLADVGRRDEALKTISQAVGMYEELAQTQPEYVLPDLAGALNNQALRLTDAGRPEEALAAISRAAEIRAQLVKTPCDASLPHLAITLSNQSNHLAQMGLRDEALAAVTQAAVIRSQLADDQPDAFLTAVTLNNQSNHLLSLGRPEEALTAITHAVRTYEELRRARPDAFLPNLAATLNNRSMALTRLGRQEEALTDIVRAVDMYEVLADSQPEVFSNDLAGALSNQANRLAGLKRYSEALTVVTRAVATHKGLPNARAKVSRPGLAAALNNQANRLADVGRRMEALIVITEAVEIYEELTQDRSGDFRQDFAQALTNQACRMADVGRAKEANPVIARSIHMLELLDQRWPQVFASRLANARLIQKELDGLAARDWDRPATPPDAPAP